MIKHKNLIFLLSLLLLLAACAPATNPNPPEIPATEPPASTEEPLPEVLRISFTYEYNFVPKNWVENYTKSETITFQQSPDNDEHLWTSKVLTPVYLYKGPLFPIQIDTFSHKNGKCETNTYYSVDSNNNQQIIAEPICRQSDIEETLISAARLPNCARDINLKLTCTYSGQFGVLQYTLNKNQDVFEFQYSGSWDLSFEHALNTSLPLLGFTNPTSEFYRSTLSNQIYTLSK